LYENTRAAFNEHRAEEGMSLLSYLDIKISQTTIRAAFVSAVRLYVQGDEKRNNARVSRHFKRLEAYFNRWARRMAVFHTAVPPPIPYATSAPLL